MLCALAGRDTTNPLPLMSSNATQAQLTFAASCGGDVRRSGGVLGAVNGFGFCSLSRA